MPPALSSSGGFPVELDTAHEALLEAWTAAERAQRYATHESGRQAADDTVAAIKRTLNALGLPWVRQLTDADWEGANWVVVGVDGAVLYERDDLVPYFWDVWKGSAMLKRRTADGGVRSLTHQEYETACERRLHGQRRRRRG